MDVVRVCGGGGCSGGGGGGGGCSGGVGAKKCCMEKKEGHSSFAGGKTHKLKHVNEKERRVHVNTI